MQRPPIREVLAETPLGRALLAFWADLPLWVFANVALAISLLPSFTAWLLGSVPLAIIASFPAAFVIAGLVNALALSVEDRSVHWRDFLRGQYAPTLSLWLALAAIGLSFEVDTPQIVFVVQCILAVTVLMLTPFGLCLPALHPNGVRLAWRNAFVLAVHFPLIALGLLAWALLLGWLVSASKGGLFLIAPTLWACTAMFSTHDTVLNMTR